MKPDLYITHLFTANEAPGVDRLREILGDRLVVFTPTTHSLDKTSSGWSLRWISEALKTDARAFVKIDPDTVISHEIEIPDEAEVAGDFRRTGLGIVWFGAFQYLTRRAAEKMLASGQDVACKYQDVYLGNLAKNLQLVAHNLEEVNGWRRQEDSEAAVEHCGRSVISRLPFGVVNWTP